MPRKTALWTLSGLLALFSLTCALAAPGDLAGRLQLLAGADGLSLDRVLSELLKSKQPKVPGQIVSVKVEEDRPARLVVRVTYKDFETDTMTVKATALASGRRASRQPIALGTSPVKAKAGEALVRLEPAEDAPVDTELRQSVLVVEIGDGRRSVVETYDCRRVWTKSGKEVFIDAVAIGPAPPRPLMGVVAEQPAVYVVRSNPAAIEAAAGAARLSVLGETQVKSGAADPATARFAQPYRTYVVQQPSRIKVLGKRRFPTGPSTPPDTTTKGPGDPYQIFETLAKQPGINLLAADLMDLHPFVYQDANPTSGVWYYAPRRYSLGWDEDDGYQLQVHYNAQTGDGKNNVNLAARLTPGIDPSDLLMARSQLESFCKAKGFKFADLLPFPTEDVMEISLAEDVRKQFKIEKDSISVTGFSDLASPIQFSLVTDAITKENLQLALTSLLGISGAVKFTSRARNGAKPISLTVPIEMRLADPQSFGARTFDKDDPLENVAPYPMKLRYLHVLMGNAQPTVYTYDLKGTQVAPGQSARVRGIPEWLNTTPKTLKVWFDYSFVQDDETTQQVLDRVTGGVVGVARAEITFKTLKVMEELGIASILAKVSSKYFDAKASAESIKTVELNKDSSSFVVGPLYLVKRSAGEVRPGDPLFKYKLTVVLQDGTMKESRDWVEANDLTVFIGKVQLKPVIDGQ
jgi:hypothetical protein